MTADPHFRLAPGSLPITPLVHIRDAQGQGVLFTAIRGPRESKLWVTAGCNVSHIPDYCGGLYITALNVSVRRVQPAMGG